MMRVQMIRREDFNQFVPTGKVCRQKVEQLETADDEGCKQEGNGRAQKGEQEPE